MAASNIGGGDADTVDDLLVEVKKLEPRAIFGFNGTVENGLRLHPDKEHMVFPLGSKISIASTKTHKQEFVSGHTNSVSCLDISLNGNLMASGQQNHMGFQAYVILWDFAARKEIARHDLHKVLVSSICFTAQDRYVVSVGGKDDGTVIVFDVEARTPICRSPAARAISGPANTVCALHNSPNHFIVCGDRHLRLWSVIRDKKKLHVHDIQVGKYHRNFTDIRVDKRDEFAYLGTMTGDIVKVALNCCDIVNVTKPSMISAMLGAYGKHNPRRSYGKDCDRFVNGVRHLHIVGNGQLLVGGGDGAIELIEERKDVNEVKMKTYPSPTWPMFRVLKAGNVHASVTSLVEINPNEFYIATEQNEIYSLNIKTFSCKLQKTCHSHDVYKIVFPKNISSVFATAGYQSIRVWSVGRLQELLRIMVWNFRCASIAFTTDGTSIISVWNDGVIRSFTPCTGRLIYAIPNAHNKGCSALAVSQNGRMIVTGGIEGQVRVWKIEPYRQSLLGVLKDHSGPISSLDFNHLDTECISACRDGSCVIWDINRMTRKQVITSNTQFMCARYFPTGVQLLTCGSDGRVSYWMVFNGSLIRELEASKKTSVNCVDINSTGDFFITVGSDQMVQFWDYDRGVALCQGSEHASAAVSCAFSPSGKFFVSGSVDGSLIIWDVPSEYWTKTRPEPTPPSPKVETPKELPKVPSGRIEKKEHIEDLAKSKGDVCKVECPPVNMKKKPDINEQCNYLMDMKRY